ncbi:hypothetical protein [Flagellimonas allohymeniacidonis]|uniref:Uncharacterized protein n=1 Tax=Flagellimonas allohymeniacidonis TaxID=2517819 RepID=A0A4V2HSR7_9FLAO|nr:hypothetical protein [Allomuricauda hymeniacidonis]TAI48840.1 hypothetical protein EW142_03315 [Allomuricauda hymeniacidonis]
MKTTAMGMVAFTTLLLVILVLMSGMNFPFHWLFYATLFGQVALIYMVYKVLTDNYKTDKTFEDFYEDHPIGQLED